MKDYLLVIPARFQSKRLPGKPLIDICGLPMIIRTYFQCRKVVQKSKIIIATDDKRIQKVCDQYNVKSILTSKSCLTGTDRIAEVANKIKAKFYINVQGDEPICNHHDLKLLIREAKKNPKIVINGYTEIKSRKLFSSEHIPKVVFSKSGKLLYQSRAPIPATKTKRFVKAWRQVCIYSFPYKLLKIFYKNKKKTTLENIEDLELLRYLELGIDVKMIKMSDKSIAVDTRQNLYEVRKLLNNNAK